MKKHLMQLASLLGGFLLAGASYGAFVQNVAITGKYKVWTVAGSVLTDAGPLVPPPPLESYLVGSATVPPGPGDNIEVDDDTDGDFSDTTTLEGDLPQGLNITIRSPNQASWQADGNALAYDYVNGALASIGKTSADWNPSGLGGLCGLFDDAVEAFVNGPPGPPTGAERASDPNVGYVELDGSELKIGLQGQLDVITAGIGPLLVGCVTGYAYNPLDPPQASEVMELTISRNGVDLYQGFQYSFEATPSGLGTQECFSTPPNLSLCSYTGNYEITLGILDYGDLPASYPTLLADDGARHIILSADNPQLAAPGDPVVDLDADGLPTADADGDNVNNIDDEEGVTIPPLIAGTTVDVVVNYVNPVGGDVFLNAWLDFDGDGVLDQIASDLVVPAGTGQITIPVAVPATATLGTVYARFRISSQAGLGLTGLAPDGEVEDYAATIRAPGGGEPSPVPAASAVSLAGGAAALLAIGLAGLRRRRSM
jgi:hypothetical protein